MSIERPSRESIHMTTASLWAERSLCKKENRKVGCVITTQDLKQILAIGYNGPPWQLGNNACTRTQGDCNCLHAEINALIKVDGSLPGKIMFVTMSPCKNCALAIAQANIHKVYFKELYRNREGLEILTKCCIEWQQL